MIAAAKTKVEPGIYRSMPDHEYRAIDALSNSDLMAWAKGGDSDIDPKHADFGSSFHAIIGEPDVAASKIVALEPRQKRKDYAESGKWVMTASDYRKLQGCYQSFKDHPACGKLMEAARDNRENCELSLVWRDEATGVLCKARLDYVSDNAVYDIKTSSADPDTFAKSIAAYGYACQAAHYLAGAAACGLPARAFRFAVACKRPDKGHPCWIHELDEVTALMGQVERGRLVSLYQRFGGSA